MVALVETVCCNSKVHESLQFTVIPIFLGEAGRVIYYMWIVIFRKSVHDEVKKHGREDNFVFGNFSKFCFVYTCGINWSFGIFHPTFDNQKNKYWVKNS